MIGCLPRKIWLYGVLAAAILTSQRVGAQTLPIIPGAFGFGMTTRAAYNGSSAPVVLRVTNLNDSGPGSFRAAVEASGPRVVIFETSGTIALGSDVRITNSFITIAGQTAPSPGITLKNFGLLVGATDVLIQHLRIRPGDGPPLQPDTAGHDGIVLYSGFTGGVAPDRVVIDHCSISWAQGKNISMFTVAPNARVTVWRSITSEALFHGKNVTVEPGTPSSNGMLVANWNVGQPMNVSVIGSLFAHNGDRNPDLEGPGSVHLINNVMYDFAQDSGTYSPWATILYGVSSFAQQIDIIGNVYIAGGGPYPFGLMGASGSYNLPAGSQVYIADNITDQTLHALPLFDLTGTDPRVVNPPVSLSGMTTLSGSSTKAFVLANAGARPLDRDAVDKRIVNDVTNHTGSMISSQDQVGGWPDLATNTRSLTLPANPNSVTSSGYTNLEVWLQGYAAAVEGSSSTSPSTLTPPLNVRIIPN